MKKYYKKIYIFILIPFLLVSIYTQHAVSQSKAGFGSIVGLRAGQVTINWGSNDGIKSGMAFVAFRHNQMVHPQTGEFLSIERDIVGKVEITNVQSTYSVGRFLSSQKTPRVGDLVELVIDDQRQYPFKDNQPPKGTVFNRNGNTISFNMGKQDGVENGLYFDVLRENKKIGMAVVTRINDTNTMAAITSGHQQVQIGDRVELADQQQADMAISNLSSQNQQVQPRAVSTSSRALTTPVMQSRQPGMLATITSINGNKLRFKWMNGITKPHSGILTGIFHQEQLTHPLTGQSLGSPSVLIGQLRIDDIKRSDGTGTLISQEIKVNMGDIIGYLTKPASSVSSPASTIPVRSPRQSGSMVRKATDLNQDVQNVQRELTYLRGMSSRISRIEKSIVSQQKITRTLSKDVGQIKKTLEAITGGTVPDGERLISGQSPIELFGSHPDQSNMYSFRVSDDFDVKLRVQDKTLLVSLDRDSIHVQDISSEQQHELSAGIKSTEDEMSESKSIVERVNDKKEQTVDLEKLLNPDVSAEDQPFYIKHWKMIAGGVGALLALLGVMMFLKKKKGGAAKATAAPDLDDDEEDEEEGGEEGEHEEEEEEEEEDNIEDF